MMNILSRLFTAGVISATATASWAQSAPVYSGPQEALETLMEALAQGGDLLTAFGPEAKGVIGSGNPERDALDRAALLVLYTEGYRFAPTDSGAELLLGADGWPFPIPLARTDAGWVFDMEAGQDEVYFRRIGLNELEAMEIMQAYVDIQAEYRLIDHDGDGVMEFAAHLISTDGARDGLYWGTEDSPLGQRIALAELDGYNDGDADQEPEPFGGYYYRILTAQSDTAPGGAMDYMVGENMVSGHALLAVPSDYGDTGIHSFMIAENGILLEADLGEDSLEMVQNMTRFDPGDTWVPVTE